MTEGHAASFQACVVKKKHKDPSPGLHSPESCGCRALPGLLPLVFRARCSLGAGGQKAWG